MRKHWLIMFPIVAVALTSCGKKQHVEATHDTCYTLEHRNEVAATLSDNEKAAFLNACHLLDAPVTIEASHETCYPQEHRAELAQSITDPAAKSRFLTACSVTDPVAPLDSISHDKEQLQ